MNNMKSVLTRKGKLIYIFFLFNEFKLSHVSRYFIELLLIRSYITRQFFSTSFQVEVKKMNADGTVDQEKKFYYEKYLPKYEWVDMSRTSRIKYTW